MVKIMVVDDEKDLRELVKGIFSIQKGYDVIEASSGYECLDKLNNVKPDLILMDEMMPGISGMKTTQRIRQNSATNDIKVVFLTVAKFTDLGKDKLKKLNAADYITKPFDNEELVKRVKKLAG